MVCHSERPHVTTIPPPHPTSPISPPYPPKHLPQHPLTPQGNDPSIPLAQPATAPETPYPHLLATLTTARNPPQTAFSHPSVIPVKTGITPLKPRTAQTDGYRDQYVLTPTLPNVKFPMLCDSGDGGVAPSKNCRIEEVHVASAVKSSNG